MTGALVILAVTAMVGLVLWLTDRPKKHKEPKDFKGLKDPTECCGMHAVCEKQSLSPVSPEIEYFDDEELDAYAGRGAGEYTEAEIEQFRDVLLTLPGGEVAAWSRSMQLRGITLPNPIRDELLIIVSEQRKQ